LIVLRHEQLDRFAHGRIKSRAANLQMGFDFVPQPKFPEFSQMIGKGLYHPTLSIYSIIYNHTFFASINCTESIFHVDRPSAQQ